MQLGPVVRDAEGGAPQGGGVLVGVAPGIDRLGVLGGVGCSLLQSHLVKTHLFGTLASYIFEAGGFNTQVFQRQAVHIMPGSGGIQHVGLEHGVVSYSVELNTVIGQYVGIVLEILANFGLVRILQQRLQLRQHHLSIQLLRRTEVVMSQRHIGCPARLHGERHADDPRLHIIETGCLGIKGK